MVPVLLERKQIYYCPECEKPCLEKDKTLDELENSIKCTDCSLWYHLVCVGITRDRDRYLICERCLLLSVLLDENVSIIDNSEDSQ